MENAGCVFLPAAGSRDGNSVSNAGTAGTYWWSTHYEVGGDAVLYIDPHNPDDIAHAISRLRDTSLRQQLIEKGRTQRAFFSWDKTSNLLWNSMMKTIER